MSDCSVCISGWDGDAPEVYNARMVKARREHKCYECGRPILRGQMYERVSGRWDGDWGTYRFCSDCEAIAKGLSCDGSRVFGNLWDDIAENVFPGMTTGCLLKVEGAAARQFLLDRWNAWKGLTAA